MSNKKVQIKNKLIIWCLAITILCFVHINAFSEQNIRVKVNGYNIMATGESAPIMVEDRVLVPMRIICEKLKCEVSWDDETQTAQIQNPTTIIAVKIGAGYITKIDREDRENVKEIPIDVPAMLVNDRTMLPARAIAEALHAIVEWDQQKNTVEITMEYDYINDFAGGLAEVCKDGKRGFINEQRELVIPLEYTYIDTTKGFIDDFVIAERNGKDGCINKKGEVVIPFKYDKIYGGSYSFSKGVTRAEVNDKWVVVDMNGNERTQLYDHVYLLEECVVVQENDKYGIVNLNDDIIIPLIYEDERCSFEDMSSRKDFEKGYFILKKDGKWGVIDKNNKAVIPFEYTAIWSSENSDIFMVEYRSEDAWNFEGTKYNFVDINGKKISFTGYYDAHPFEDGVAAVREKTGWGFINSNGKVIVPTIYADVDLLRSLTLKTDDGTWVTFDKNGNVIK